MKNILQWLLLILCASFIAHYFSTNREEAAILLKINSQQIATLISLHLLYLLLQGYRYLLVLKKCSERSIEFLSWFRFFVLGRFLSTIIPQAGNIYRSIRIKEEYQVSYTRYISSFFSFAWMDTCFNLMIAMVIVWTMEPQISFGNLKVLYLIMMLEVLFLGAPILADKIARSFTINTKILSWVHMKLSEALRVSVNSLQDTQYVTKMFLMGLVGFCHAVAIFYVTFAALGIRVGLTSLVLFYVFMKLSTHINLTPGNLGIQEVGFGALGHLMQVGMAEGMLFSALLRVSGLIALVCLALPMGGLNLLRHKDRFKNNANNKADIQ